MRATLAALTLLLAGTGAAPAAAAPDPPADRPADLRADLENMADSYGRITGPGGQLQNPAYLPALLQQVPARYVAQLLTQVASLDRPSVTAGNLVPGWNVGNPLRAGWDGTHGRSREVSFENEYGALLRGTVHRPLPRATDPYTGERLRPPYPGVVITEGSIQGSEGMYEWLAQDLAERGYVVLTYDVQGQGTSETLPHGEPFDCCSGVPSQQLDNFVVGTDAALDFFTSRANPFRRFFDRSPDPDPATPGRTTRIALVGHSLGATAVTQVQATDDRVAALVALDKLSEAEPVVPALAVQSEYFFAPTPADPDADPGQEKATGYDAWVAAGTDAMLVVPRASTHLEYTDIPLVLPASRWGQALTSVYVQRWLDRYLKHAPAAPLLATSFRYLEPVGHGVWEPVRLQRDQHLSTTSCSAYSLTTVRGRAEDGDITRLGC